MEKDILDIFDDKTYDKEKEEKNKKLASLLNDLDELDEKRLKSDKYNNEIAKILIDESLQ